MSPNRTVCVSGCAQLVQKMTEQDVLHEAYYQALKGMQLAEGQPLPRLKLLELSRAGDARIFEVIEE